MGARRPSAWFPAARGNDLARSLGLPLTLMEALTVALGEHTRPIDLGMASHDGETRYFSAAGGTGFDAQVAFTMAGKRARWQRGRAGYFLSTLNELRRYKNRTLSLRLATDAGDRQVEGQLPVRGLRQRPVLRRRHADLPRCVDQ